ncbi:hypothetical protein RDABS01_026080 [Bienertia sinuspersici]
MSFFMGCFGCTSSCDATNNDRVTPEGVSVDKTTSSEGVKRYSWAEIESLTMNFKEVIGVGGYSTVYLAKFHDSSLGAIKIYNSSDRLNQVFKSELEISQKLHHAYIVKLVGYCDERDEGALVFEYMRKGNLQEELHDNHYQISSGDKNLKPQKLTWKQRISIAYQLAQALEYLHDSGDLHIVHGDIKSSNILLDDHLNCKLCDFGCAKMGFSSMIEPPSSSRIAMMGSPGYIDPHFLMTGIASKKSDVYSFGVILLQLITGIEAFVSSGEEKQVLLTSIVRSKGSFDVDKVLKMVDPTIQSIDIEQLKTLAYIAGGCLNQLPSLRLSASDICNIMREKLWCHQKV